MEGSSHTENLQKKSKLSAYALWFSERFPAINFVSSYLLFAFVFVYASVLNQSSMEWTIKEIFLALGILTQLLLLRVLDEFKDHEYDKEHHPDRVLQKGILGLDDLRAILFLSVSAQVVLNIIWGDPLNGSWLLMMLWTFLMTKEFFIGNWLRKRVFLYLFSHMTVMIFLVSWLFSFYGLSVTDSWPALSLIFIGSVLYEITRKSRGLDEDKRLDSYPKVIGFLGNTTLMLTLALGLFVVKFVFIVNQFHWIYTWDLLAGFIFVVSLFLFHLKRRKKFRKVLEANYGGLMMALYLSYVINQMV